MANFINWLLDRLGERSTWASLAGVAAGVFGWTITPEFQEELTTAGLALVSLAAFLMKEEK